MGFKAWYDNRADDLTKEGMLKGIERAAAFILFLSSGVLQRPYCQLEIKHAVALKKPIILLHGELSEVRAHWERAAIGLPGRPPPALVSNPTSLSGVFDTARVSALLCLVLALCFAFTYTNTKPPTHKQRATRATAASTSAPRTPRRPPTCRSCLISTSRFPSGGGGTSETEC